MSAQHAIKKQKDFKAVQVIGSHYEAIVQTEPDARVIGCPYRVKVHCANSGGMSSSVVDVQL